MRIVSLLPSTTEIIFAIGAGADLVGVTFECDFPPEARRLPVVSTSALTQGLTPAEIDSEVRARIAAGEDLYHLDEGTLRDLAPDLVITQDLCAVCAVDLTSVEAALDHLGCGGQALTIDPGTLGEVVGSIATIGSATGHEPEAQRLVAALQARLAKVIAAVQRWPRPRVAVLEWTDPLFSAGHWVPDMVQAAGGESLLGIPGERSTPIAPEVVASCGAELIVVAPCGYRLDGAHKLAADLLDSAVLPSGVPVWAVATRHAAFVRPGPRLLDGIEALAAICHPGALPDRPEVAAFVGFAPPRS